MRPVLFTVGGFDVTGYGVSKALAALVAWWLLARELRRVRLDPGAAWPLTLAGLLGGFAGAKLYYLIEYAGSLSVHDLGGLGFTWFGGLVGGAAAVLVVARRHRLALPLVCGLAAAPLTFAYGIGRLGCLLAGDGTYGTPSNLPWAMSFPHGTVPTTDRVHPAPLYEALLAIAIGALLWRLRTRVRPEISFALFAILEGAARFVVEFVRLDAPVIAGLNQPQLWSLALMALGVAIVVRATRAPGGVRALPVGT